MFDTTHVVSAVAVLASFIVGLKFGSRSAGGNKEMRNGTESNTTAPKKEEENVSFLLQFVLSNSRYLT